MSLFLSENVIIDMLESLDRYQFPVPNSQDAHLCVPRGLRYHQMASDVEFEQPASCFFVFHLREFVYGIEYHIVGLGTSAVDIPQIFRVVALEDRHRDKGDAIVMQNGKQFFILCSLISFG